MSVAAVRTRFAPSPTGFLHLGGLRTALFNYLFARKMQGQFLLRIEDTDQTRLVPGSTENIVGLLSWAGISIDEGPHVGGPFGPYVQSLRLGHYRMHAEMLVEAGHGYHCFCSESRLESLRQASHQRGLPLMYDRRCLGLSKEDVRARIQGGEKSVVRLKAPLGITTVNDVLRGKVVFDNKTIDDPVLLKSDGFPTYHLASVVDDHLMQISHVIRGEEWLPSASKHVLLYDALGWQKPHFVHLPLLTNPDGSKLSKRQGHATVEHYKEAGYLPRSVLNFVALLGWHPGTQQEIFSREELIEEFDLSRLNKSSAVVDLEKLNWVQQQHIRWLADHDMETLFRLAEPFLVAALPQSLLQRQRLLSVMRLLKERILFIADVPRLVMPFFGDVEVPAVLRAELHGKFGEYDMASLNLLLFTALSALEQWSIESVSEELKTFCKQQRLPFKHVMLHLRVFLTGTSAGASLPETMVMLGRSTVLGRLSTSA